MGEPTFRILTTTPKTELLLLVSVIREVRIHVVDGLAAIELVAYRVCLKRISCVYMMG